MLLLTYLGAKPAAATNYRQSKLLSYSTEQGINRESPAGRLRILFREYSLRDSTN
jgi:hypothetical protein